MPVSTSHRWLFEVDLEPVSGSRFQPTGFPDIGAAQFERPVRVNGSVAWATALLVESAQSMANHLERVGWDAGEDQPVDVLRGLPYVRVEDAATGEYLTSSRTEAHRLASAFVKDATLDGKDMRSVIRERLGLRDDHPMSARRIAAAVFDLDPMCLVHGVFFAEAASVWPGQPKIARALTGYVEAIDTKAAHSGGVKKDHVRHSLGDTGGTAEGYGTVPFHRTEFTAGRILASFCIDRAQIRSYGLAPAHMELLESIALWEVRALLDGGLRLRTACDLAPAGDVADQSGNPLPSTEELASRVRGGIASCGLAGGAPMVVQWRAEKKGKKAKDTEAG